MALGMKSAHRSENNRRQWRQPVISESVSEMAKVMAAYQ
jgi:hypothetical protein